MKTNLFRVGLFGLTLLVSLLFATTTSVSAQPGTEQQLTNFSLRARVGNEDRITFGFVISSSAAEGTKKVLIRGIGPTLSAFGVDGVADTRLVLQNWQSLATNEGWSGDITTQAVTAQAGAFPLTIGSKDSVIIADLAPGAYTVTLSAKSAGITGIGLLEVYDASKTVGGKFINLSAGVRATGNDADAAIMGFTYEGTGQRQLLFRGIGPTLEYFGVTGFMLNPILEVYSGERMINGNDNGWSSTRQLQLLNQTAAGRVGAFPLPLGSGDAAIVSTVTINGPSPFSVKVGGKDKESGIVLAEVYEYNF